MDLPVTIRTLSLRKIKVLHLEPTDVCQAACPLCSRETNAEFDAKCQHHLTVDNIRKHFDDYVISTFDKIFMCGNYGDPAAGKHTVDIYQWARKLNPWLLTNSLTIKPINYVITLPKPPYKLKNYVEYKQ